jgi:septum formation topological specificity factor MinE
MDSVEFDRIAKDRCQMRPDHRRARRPPRVLTEELLRDYLERFMKHVEVDDEEYAKQGFVDVFQVGRNLLSPNSAPMQPIYNVDHNY